MIGEPMKPFSPPLRQRPLSQLCHNNSSQTAQRQQRSLEFCTQLQEGIFLPGFKFQGQGCRMTASVLPSIPWPDPASHSGGPDANSSHHQHHI